MTQPAAADIESRFTEAALGNVQVADYRNFAHGRHHWLARKADETAVLMLSTPEDKATAERTTCLLPKSIPVLHLRFAAGSPGMLSAVLHSIYLGWFAARANAIDPGRPKVPQFGRRLYHLRAIPKAPPAEIAISDLEASAIERKSGFAVATLHSRNQLDEWRNRYHSFLERLTRVSFSGVILDYDGTLCGSTERFTGLRKEVFLALVSLLRAGILLGIATGRGKSVRKELQARIRLARLRKQVLIGYHNAGEIGALDDNDVPPADPPLHDSLLSVNDALNGNSFVLRHSTRNAKGRQITLETTCPAIAPDLWSCVSGIVRSHGEVGVTAVQSSHSIDILAPGVSKQSLITALMERLPQSHEHSAILCIGDRGRWPGNDFELLQHPLSLSVDQTSSDPDTCWNLAPPSSRYVDACLYYLRPMKVHVGGFRLSRLADRRRPQ
jgi:hypothetical protein